MELKEFMERLRLARWYLDRAENARKHGRYGTVSRKIEQARNVLAILEKGEDDAEKQEKNPITAAND